MIKNVIFDCGQVLIRYKEVEIAANFTDNAADAEILGKVGMARKYWDRFDLGTLEEADYLEQVKKEIPEHLHTAVEKLAEEWVKCCPPIPGMEEIVCDVKKAGKKLYLLGSKPGIAELAAEKMLAKHPGLTIAGMADGYFKDEAPVVEKINAVKPDVLFVCLGAPKQEKWMARWGEHTGARLAIGLGGVLDVYAGNVERAPESWQKLGLEWAYRLKKEPKRITRMAKLPLVLVKSAGQRVKGKGK